MPAVFLFLGSIELCQQEWQKAQSVAGHEIHMGGGLMVRDDS